MRIANSVFLIAAFALGIAPAQEKPRRGSIAGTVTESGSGVPMKGVEVSISWGGLPPRATTTDPQGRYTLREVEPGLTRVVAMAVDESGNTGFGPSASRQLTLAEGQELTGVDFKLVVPGKVSGRVVDQNKEAVVGIGVYLVAREYSFGALRAFYAGASTTDDQGQYVIGRVFPGRAYYVVATVRRTLPAISDAPLDPKLRRPAVVPTFYPDARMIEGGQPLVLRPGELREGVDIRTVRSPSFCVEGVLEGSNGPAGTEFNIQETQPTSGRSGNGGMYIATPGGKTGPDGKVRICGLHPGDYELSVSGYNRSTPFGEITSFGSMVVTIGERDLGIVRLTARPPLPLSGEVILEGPPPEKPLAATLRIDVESISRTIRANATAPIPGTFDFAKGLVPDEFSLEFRSLPAGLYVKDVSYGDRSIREGSLRMGTATGNSGLRIVVGRDGGTVNAHAVERDHPVVDCTIVLMQPAAESEAAFAASLKTGKTGIDGAWTTPTVAPGKYLILATNDEVNRSPESVAKLWKARSRATEVEVPPGGKAATVLEIKSIE